MTWRVHTLKGCAPTPLAHYLKALGVLRLLGQQKDAEVRAYWNEDEFVLVTRLSEGELEQFFLQEYAPTPMLTPWNGGSGFYPKDQKAGIDAVGASTLPRFLAYRIAIESARELVGDRAESPKDEEKGKLLKQCKARWSAAALEWVNAATVVTRTTEIAYPAVLGSGGNDGRLDFTNNFMQRLVGLLPTHQNDSAPPESRACLRNALWGVPFHGLSSVPIGQFLPGGAGGLNGTTGFSGSSQVNPWDFVLMLEGAMVLQVTSVRRLDEAGGYGLPQASAPFAVRSRAEGYASAAPADESARGEQWFPLWGNPATLAEVAGLFSEGRLQAGKKRADEALEAAQALSRLGVARGITTFQRFGYAERNGQANLAVPLGRWRVANKPNVQLLDEIQDWVTRLRRAGDKQKAFERHAHRLERLMLAVCAQTAGNGGTQFQRLLEALGDAEAEMVHRPRATADAALRPIPSLDPGWLDAVGDTPPLEFRLARAIASQYDRRARSSLRPNLAPIDGVRFRTAQDSLAKDNDVVWTDRDLVDDLGKVLVRRLLPRRESEATTKAKAPGDDARLFPLDGCYPAALDDVLQFLLGELDEARVTSLTRALLAVRMERPESTHREKLDLAALRLDIPAPYAALRVLYSPWRLDDPPLTGPLKTPAHPNLSVRAHRTPLAQLAAGRLEEATALAVQFLKNAGGRPKLSRFMGSRKLARRILASLAIPISWMDITRLASLIFKPELVVGQQPKKSDEEEMALSSFNPPPARSDL